MTVTETRMRVRARAGLGAMLALALAGLAGCGRGGMSELECMERVIYFEANRSSRDGMIAVGNVVMNRVRAQGYPNPVCGVVGQKGQFAPGVLTRRMDSKSLPAVREAAIAVLRGERQPGIGNAMFFHQKDHRFSYGNMHYVLVAGGNAFYEKRKSHLVTQPVPPAPVDGLR